MFIHVGSIVRIHPFHGGEIGTVVEYDTFDDTFRLYHNHRWMDDSMVVEVIGEDPDFSDGRLFGFVKGDEVEVKSLGEIRADELNFDFDSFFTDKMSYLCGRRFVIDSVEEADCDAAIVQLAGLSGLDATWTFTTAMFRRVDPDEDSKIDIDSADFLSVLCGGDVLRST